MEINVYVKFSAKPPRCLALKRAWHRMTPTLGLDMTAFDIPKQRETKSISFRTGDNGLHLEEERKIPYSYFTAKRLKRMGIEEIAIRLPYNTECDSSEMKGIFNNLLIHGGKQYLEGVSSMVFDKESFKYAWQEAAGMMGCFLPMMGFILLAYSFKIGLIPFDALNVITSLGLLSYISSLISKNSLHRNTADFLSANLTRRDGKDVLLLPKGEDHAIKRMFLGEERAGFSCEETNYEIAERIVKEHIRGKKVLVVPAYAANAFIFAELGAKMVYGLDIDPITITWLRAIQRCYFHKTNKSESIREKVLNYDLPREFWSQNHREFSQRDLCENLQKALRETRGKRLRLTLPNLHFLRAALGPPQQEQDKIPRIGQLFKEGHFDFIYVPYLLGINNGIESEGAIKEALEELWQVAKPGAIIMIMPFGEQRIDGSSVGDLANLIPKDKYQTYGEISFESTSFVGFLFGAPVINEKDTVKVGLLRVIK